MVADELLSVRSLMTAAGSASFQRGQPYVRRVQELVIGKAEARASIWGSSVYAVELDWSGRRLTGRCTCPHHARGHFCKHLVALGLAVLDGAGSVDTDHHGVDPRRPERDGPSEAGADLDGDVDAAVALLARGHPQYAAIVDRLRIAERFDEVTEWVDRGVAAGRVSAERSGSRDYWLDPQEVAGEYLALDRVDDAVAVFRDAFTRRPELATHGELVAFTESIGLGEENREWAGRWLREGATSLPSSAALLVQIALVEDDLDAAWAVADELGCGHAWQSLAAASAERMPSRAAALHRREVERLLRAPGPGRYSAIAAALATVRELSLRAGEEREFAAYLTDIRTTYRRRSALLAALERWRL